MKRSSVRGRPVGSRLGTKSRTRSLRIENLEGRNLLTIGVYAMETLQSPVVHVEIQCELGYSSNDTATLETLSDGDIRLTANGQVLQSLTPLAAVGLVTYGGDDRVDASGLSESTAAVIWLGEGADVGIGGTGPDWIMGEGGPDWLEGRLGSDHLYGGLRVDVIGGNAINVQPDGTVTGLADGVVDFLFGECGDEDYVGLESLDWHDTENVPGKADHYYWEEYVPPVAPLPSGWSDIDGRVTIDANTAQNVTPHVVDGILTVTWNGGSRTFGDAQRIIWEGTPYADDLNFSGLSARLTVHGRAGNDRIVGGEAADELFGQEGDDSLIGSGGFDFLEGGPGNDFLDAITGEATDVADTLKADDGISRNDQLRYRAADVVFRDPDGGGDVIEVINTIDDQTGACLYQANEVEIVQVTVTDPNGAVVDGLFYNLYLNDQLVTPNPRRVNGDITVRYGETFTVTSLPGNDLRVEMDLQGYRLSSELVDAVHTSDPNLG